MIHGGNVWQGDGPGGWLDYSANIRPEGAPEWVREALLAAGIDPARRAETLTLEEFADLSNEVYSRL